MSKASQLRQKAQIALKKGKTAEAIDTYRKLLQVEPRNPNLHNELGDIYLRSDDRIQAVGSFEQAILNYEKVALYNNAVAVCKKILRVVPDRPETVFKVGELKAKQKFTGEAMTAFAQYFDSLLGGAAQVNEAAMKKAEKALELLPGNEEVSVRAADLLARGGHTARAAEILAHTVASAGGGERTRLYRQRLETLRQSLGPEDQAKIEGILASTAAPAADEEIPAREAHAAAQAAQAASADSRETAAADEEAPEEEYVIDIGGDGPPAGECVAQAGEPPASAVEYAVDPPPAETSAPERECGASLERTAAREQTSGAVAGAAVAAGAGPNATISEDLADILDAEDAAMEEAQYVASSLTEEITSDVEEDDYRSHYDLGMAYIEMALYNEAIKELQISSRSEQLQLRSLEMIGHCFLLLQNPRLAVKQLTRGLDISRVSGGDSLGIHYNLGLAYEALGEIEKAREHFEEVYIVDVTFRDISDKMKKYSTVG
ncbi:MAG: tetratricopeptide repeat protein [Candidatus Krumholzibacteria bacterium]|nr:tetratricopeptide repeat protein [Candidatus Krumholzibacteria bacterium]